MSLELVLAAAFLLSLERMVYVWASCAPESFSAWCHRTP